MSNEQRQSMREVTARFVRQRIEPCVARPETPADADTVTGVLDDADALGLCGTDAEPSGLAPWEELDDGSPPAATLVTLIDLARASPAIALAIHQRALARAVARRVALPLAARPAIAARGGFGLGRGALVHLLAGRRLDTDDHDLLTGLYGPEVVRVLSVEPAADALLVPVFDAGQLGWQVHPRARLRWTRERDGHGLDELHTVAAAAAAAGTAAAAPVDLTCAALAADQLAHVAIALGATMRARAIASRYAAQRRQGGAPIDRHPAVQALLGAASTAIATAAMQLEALGGRPLARERLPAALALRAQAHPALADAANGALQAMGGIGYMRDAGVEKMVRDVNHLRALAGAPGELMLMVAEWDRLQAMEEASGA